MSVSYQVSLVHRFYALFKIYVIFTQKVKLRRGIARISFEQNKKRYEKNRHNPPDALATPDLRHLRRSGTRAGSDPQKEKVVGIREQRQIIKNNV